MSTIATRRAPLSELVLALLLAAIVFDVVVLAWGETPSAIARQIVVGTWGNAYGVGQVLFKATSILLAAVGARIALRAGLFNIGVDGSIAVSALAVGAVGASLPPGISPFVAWPLLALVAMITAAAWTLPAGILRARFGAHEVISGIMLNNIAAALVGWLLTRGLAERASVHTRSLPPGALTTRLDRLGHWGLVEWTTPAIVVRFLRALHGSAANVAVLVAIVVLFAWTWSARRTVFGRELLAVGASQSASRAAGTPVGRRLVQALALSGAVAGLTALNDVMGYKGYAEQGLSSGVGFTGLAAAIIGGETAIGLIAASLLYATLSQGGLAINAHVPMEIVEVLSAVLILLVSAGPGLRRALLDRAPKRRPEDGA